MLENEQYKEAMTLVIHAEAKERLAKGKGDSKFRSQLHSVLEEVHRLDTTLTECANQHIPL